MAGIPLSEYIRRRKLSRAAVDLQYPESKVIADALKYGYESPTAFNRAFKKVHGISPSEVRTKGNLITTYPPISFKITIKGSSAMEYRIENKKAFRIIGICFPLCEEIENNFEVVPKMWAEAAVNGTIQRLAGLMDGPTKGLLGVSSCNEKTEWKYYIAISSNSNLDGEFEEYTVPEYTWAIFSGKGFNQSIQELEKRIVTEWLPTSGYEYGDAPDIEVYINPDPNNAIYEVWIPVVLKNERRI